ncbi:hypothetical protein JXA48_05005 [Candidatus Woesearchaeota archaeon]|nr:hypothetical protein [Candidatus Woesearchaeota archaeon]
MKKQVLILFTILLFTLSFSSLALAADVFVQFPSSSIESFYISSASTELSMCSCSTGTDVVQVVNDGSMPIKIDLSSNLDYVSFSQNSVNLVPGSSQMVYMYVHAPCGVSKDNLEITGTSVYGESQVLQRKLSFSSCDNLVVLPGDDKQTSVCTSFKDNFTILNTGSFAEDYEVEIKNFQSYSSVAKKIVTIPAQTKFDYVVSYNIPCDISGEQTLDYKVTALKNSREIDFSKNLNISPDYNFDVAGPTEMIVCDGTQQSYNITIRNQNHFEDEFLVKLYGPSFADLKLPSAILGIESNTLILNSSTYTDIPLVISPNGAKHDGDYNVTVEVSSLTGRVVEELVMPLSVKHCYDFSNLLSVPEKDVNVCAGETKSLDLVMEHKGVSPAVVQLNITGPDYVKLSSDFVIFDGKEGKKSSIIIDDAPNRNEVSTVNVDAYFNNELVDSDSFDIVLNNKTKCYGIYATKSNLDVRYDSENVYVNVKNLGIQDGFYTPTAFSLPSYLTLKSGPQMINSSDDLYLEFSIDRDALVAYAQMANNGSIVGVENSFLLSMEHSSGAEFYSKITVKFVDKPWYEWMIINISTWWNSLSLCLQVFFVLSFLAAIFLIVLVVKLFLGRHFFAAKVLGIVLLVLFILATIVVLSWKGVPTKSMFYTSYDLETNSTIYLKLEEDSTRSFDLNEFFFDPDYNIVDYEVTLGDDSHLSAVVKRSKLKITPDKDWNGLTKLELTAIDSAGESASSGDIYVDVLPVEDYSIGGFFSLACSYFNLVMFAIVCLLLYLVVSFKRGFREVKDEKQLTLMETVIVKKEKSPKQDVIIQVDKPVKKSSTKKASTKKASKKSAKKSSKKVAKKAKSAGTVSSKVDVSNFKVENP